jgi:hypothetical protein
MTHCVPVADSDSSLWIRGIAIATIVWSMNVIPTANTIASSTKFFFELIRAPHVQVDQPIGLRESDTEAPSGIDLRSNDYN